MGIETRHSDLAHFEIAPEIAVGIETRHGDLAHFEIAPETWSGIVSIFAHVPPDLRRAVYRRVVDGLRPGGVLILEAYAPEQLRFGTGGPPVAELTMDLATLEDELAGRPWAGNGPRRAPTALFRLNPHHPIEVMALS